MRNELLSLLSFSLGIAAYSCRELYYHGKLRWTGKNELGFWGSKSDLRKYKMRKNPLVDVGAYAIMPESKAPDTLYYRLTGLKYKEKFPLAGSLLVWTTDGPHLFQALFFLFISLSVVPILGWTYGIAFWILAHVIHFVLYRTLQR